LPVFIFITKGTEMMIKKRVAVVLLSGVILSAGLAVSASQPADVAGRWTMAVQTRRGTFNQRMTIEQNGNAIKGTLQGRRGDVPFEGSVKGNRVKFTVTRDTPRGTFTMEYEGTAHGDSMKGTARTPRFSMDWTAQRGTESQ
jgi:hypothetical protein